MRYVDSLRSHLEAVRRGTVRWIEVDSAELRTYQQRLARAIQSVVDLRPGDEEHRGSDELFRRWSDGELLGSLLESLIGTILELSPELPREGVASRVEYALLWLLAEDSEGSIDAPVSRWPRLETVLLEQAAESVGVMQLALFDARVASPERYARQLGLTRAAGDKVGLGASGDLLLRLAPTDTALWLLALECARCGDTTDTQYVSLAVLTTLTRDSEFVFGHRDRALMRLRQRSPADREYRALKRLQALGVVTSHAPDADDEYGQFEGHEHFRLTTHGRGILQELMKAESPLVLLAAAVSRDEAAGIARDPSLVLPARGSGPSAVAETIRHMHMVVHEFRNALVPVQVAFDGLWRRLPPDVASPGLDGYRGTILAGLRRMFESVDESARLARMVPSPPEPFDLVDAVREAVSAVEAEFEREIHLDNQLTGAAASLVIGHRRRFVLALINVVRNARQANTAAVKVGLTLSAVAVPATISLRVEDDGRGIPSEHHTTIFQPGFSLRADGSGHGLALVREVIVEEMRGTVECADSDWGGALFSFQLPTSNGGRS